MNFFRHLITLVLLASLSTGLSGQSLKAYLKKADEAYYSRNYTTALAHYRTVLSEEPNRVDALFKAGQSARQLRSYKLAEQYYESIPNDDKKGEYELTDFWCANVKKSMEKFDEASVLFEDFALAHPENIEYQQKAYGEIDNCDWALEMVLNPIKVEINRMEEHVNSYYADYAPAILGDTVFYTSTAKVEIDKRKNSKKKKKRKRNKKKLAKKGKKKDKTRYAYVTKIFQSVSGSKGKPIRQNSRKDNHHTANLTFNTSKTRMYYTICPTNPETGKNECILYYRERGYSGNWERARRLPDNVNMDGYIFTQPTVGIDARTGKEVLFFSSNRPGGMGGMDIWYSFVGTEGDFSEPQNLRVVNSSGDELSPFFETHAQTLYFSSDDFQNLGGYDIFKSIKKDKEWTAPENLGYPINTSYDEMYYTFDVPSGRVLFASNRPGSLCISENKDCNLHDIYELVPSLDLVVSAFNEIDFSLLKGTTMELVDKLTGDSETFIMGGEEFYIHLPLSPGRDYDLIVNKDGYQTAETVVSTKNFTEDTEPKKYVFLKPTQRLVIKTVDEESQEPIQGMSVRVTDMTNNDSKTYQMEETQSEISVPVEEDKEYIVVGIKSGFDAVSTKVSTEGKQSELVLNENLSVKSFMSGLPLTIFFDNDYPSDEVDVENLTYEGAYKAYINRKGEFINEFVSGLTGIDKELARLEGMQFFDEELQAGYYGLLKFTENLLFYLQNGDRVELIIEGYASPIADANYNERLAQRRILTIKNYFNQYANGALNEYMDKSFVIRGRPLGESLASQEVSDDSEDRRSSVFSPRASKERKVIIAGFRTTGDNVTSK